MYVSSVNLVSSSRVNKLTQTKKSQAVQQNPNFKRTAYKAAFAKYFNGPKVPNEQIYRDLMSKAQRASGFVVDEIAGTFFKPGDYNKVMNGFRNSQPVYDTLNDNSHHTPVWLVKNGNSMVSSIVNFGRLGGFFDAIFGDSKQDTRICFHGVDEYKKCVICLGKDFSGNDTCTITKDGIGTLIGAEIASKL